MADTHWKEWNPTAISVVAKTYGRFVVSQVFSLTLYVLHLFYYVPNTEEANESQALTGLKLDSEQM